MNFAEFHFIRPYCLLATFPYLAIIVLMFRNKLSLGNWSAVCDEALLPYLLQEKAVQQSRWPLITGSIAAFLAIVALAGPTWQRLPSPVFRNESALVIALDLSRSMDAADIKPSRLTIARYKIADILKKRKDGQTALLVYAGDAFTVTPLTDDVATIDNQLNALTTDIMPSGGSNTAQALNKAVDLLKQAGLQKGQILLITDGADPDKTLSTIHKLGDYNLSILGVGTADGAPIALPDGGFMKDAQGSIVIPKLNANDLETLAQAGHGIYQTLTSDDRDIQTLLARVDKPAEQKGKQANDLKLDQWKEKGPWLLLLVLPLTAALFRKGLICLVFVLLLPVPKTSYAFEWQDLWQSKDQQAQQAYDKQDYHKAADLFQDKAWKAAASFKALKKEAEDAATFKSLAKKAEDIDLKSLGNVENAKTAIQAYNQGNALAQSGQLEEALKAYEKALQLNPEDRDAKFNKELVEKALEKQKQQQQKQDHQQKDKEKSKQDKQDKEQQSKDEEQKKQDEQKAAEQKKQQEQQDAEQKPENKPESKSSDQQQSTDKKENAKPEEKKPEQQKPEPTEQNKAQDKDKDKPEQAAPMDEKPTDEKQQANEQWLNRIPDDPAGLLRRKFKYQYGQQEHNSESNAEEW